MKRFIIFLIRKRLGLKKNELFRFSNQLEQSVYYFTDTTLMKIKYGYVDKSGVSLNWLLDDECKIEKMVLRGNVYENKEKMEHWKQEVAKKMPDEQRHYSENTTADDVR